MKKGKRKYRSLRDWNEGKFDYTIGIDVIGSDEVHTLSVRANSKKQAFKDAELIITHNGMTFLAKSTMRVLKREQAKDRYTFNLKWAF